MNDMHSNWPKNLKLKAISILETIDFNISTPSKKQVLNFFKMDPMKIKIVILGQDPYPQQGIANGRAFAVNKNSKIPQSLHNIFKEIKEIQGFLKTDCTLDHWEENGVLLLNAALTTQINKPGSHQKIWKNFSILLMKWIDQNLNIIWVLWGNHARQFKSILSKQVIEDAHPSPLSVRHRNKNTFKELNFINW